MLVLKISLGTWENESRDKRELSVCRELGLQTLVMAKGEVKDKFREDNVDGFKVLRFSTKPLGLHAPNAINRLASVFMWVHYARKLKPDIISGHDLGALTIGYLSNFFRRKKATLIYDSHEFELGRNTGGKRGQLVSRIIAFEEKFLIKRCAFSIMVNDSIANEVQRIHKLKTRPIVVRSIPNYWKIDATKCENKRNELLEKLPNVKYLLIRHGNVSNGSGIEAVMSAVSLYSDIGLLLLGNQNQLNYSRSLVELIEKLDIQDRVLFLNAVELNSLWEYVGAADIEMIMTEPIVDSHYYVLPNKFFESIQSEVPIIASELPEMRKLIDQYGIGLTCKPNDVAGICLCIEKMRFEEGFYNRCKENLKNAKKDLCWENEKKILMRAYKSIIRPKARD